MDNDKILLYDLPSKLGNVCWSPNVWKTRLLLNCKRLPYDTQWVDFPDIEDTLKSQGVAPASTVALGANVGTRYTLPTIRLHGKFVMDSVKIVVELDRIEESPPMHLELGLHEHAQGILRKIAWPLYPEIAPHIRDNLLTDHGKAHWVTARETLFGTSIDDVHQAKGGELAWKAAQPGIDELVEFMKSHKRDSGPFVLGSSVSYADFVIVAFLASTRLVGQAIFDRIVGSAESVQVLWAACDRWLLKNQ